MVDRCKALSVSAMRVEGGVSDMGKIAGFSASAVPYSGKNALWKNSFFAGHGVDSPATVSPLRRSL